MSIRADIIIKNAAQLVTSFWGQTGTGQEADSGLLLIEDAALAARGEKIVAVGKTSAVMDAVDASNAKVIDAAGQLVTPGFVDPHTHPVFAATRQDEFEMRIRGKTYREIAMAGGGIKSSVRKVREAGEDYLRRQATLHLDRFLACGTTTIEAKSGYGLSVADELKLLRVIKELAEGHVVEVLPTFLGAHEIPEEYRGRREYYIDLIIEEMLPRVAEEKLAVFCDVFCEEHVFTFDESKRILQAAQKVGLIPKIHADQLSDGRGAELAAKVGAISADHLDHISDEGISALAGSDVIPVLLPGAVFFLGLKKYAPARKMIRAGLPVALATDFNPGSSPSQSMPMMMALACTQMHMTPAEALVASTVHAAAAIGRVDEIGRLEVGMQADFVIFNLEDYKLLPYHFGMNFVDKVVKKGNIVFKSGNEIHDNANIKI